MMNMANMTTRRTDKEVLNVICAAVEREEVITIETIASHLDCAPLTVIRALGRLEALKRIEVNRDQKPNRYRVLL